MSLNSHWMSRKEFVFFSGNSSDSIETNLFGKISSFFSRNDFQRLIVDPIGFLFFVHFSFLLRFSSLSSPKTLDTNLLRRSESDRIWKEITNRTSLRSFGVELNRIKQVFAGQRRSFSNRLTIGLFLSVLVNSSLFAEVQLSLIERRIC